MTTIRSQVYTWDDDEAPPAPRLPVRCLEDELLPDAQPISSRHTCCVCGVEMAKKAGGLVRWCSSQRCQDAKALREKMRLEQTDRRSLIRRKKS